MAETKLTSIQIINDENVVRDCIVYGLQYCCTSSYYRETAWIKNHFPAIKGPEAYLSQWYIPLIKKGFSLPLFFILDLGLLFLFGQPALQSSGPMRKADKNKVQIQSNYYRWLYGLLSSKGFQSLTTLIERDGRRKKLRTAWNIYRTERKIAPDNFENLHEETGPYSLVEAKFNAVPAFLDLYLGELDAGYTPKYIFHPNIFSDPVKFASVWSASTPSRYIGLAEQINIDFLSEIVKTASSSENVVFSNLDQFLIRTRCLGHRDVDDLDLKLLKNYVQHYQLEDAAIDLLKQETLPLKRARVLIPEKTRSKDGGYHGIDYDGDWSSFVRSQLAIFNVKPELFFHNYYNHKLLYYDRRQMQSRPLSILMAFFINSGPEMRCRAENIGYKNALARELAAYFIEDLMRWVGMASSVNLDIYLTCYRPGKVGTEIFFNATEEKSFLVNLEDPILTNVFKTLDEFFFLDSAGAKPELFEPLSQEKIIAATAERFHKYMIDEYVLRAQQGKSQMEYDCGQIILLTDQFDRSDTELFPHFGVRMRSQMSHLFTLQDTGVGWATAKSTDGGWNPKDEKFQTYAQVRNGTDQSLRVDFLRTVIRETLRHATYL